MANVDKIILNGTQYDLPSGGGTVDAYTKSESDDQNKVIASALTELHNDKADKQQLNNYQLKGDYQTGAQVDAKIATAVADYRTEAEAIKVEKVDAAALNDLDARVSDLEQGGGGSGITGITMNGSAVTVTSGVANLGTVVTDKSDKQDVIDSSHKLSADLVDDTTSTNKFVTSSDKSTWSGKQDALVSGTNIKTINNESILGEGNITISGGTQVQSDWNQSDTTAVDYIKNKPDVVNTVTTASSGANRNLLVKKNNGDYETLFKFASINGESIAALSFQKNPAFSLQETLVSGTNIKTINNESILGEGNITIEGGGASYTAGDGIDITSGVISNTREQRVLTFEDSATGVKAALRVISPHWGYTEETVSDPANSLTFVNNVPAANADPYVQANYLDGTLMEFEITYYSIDSSSDFSFDPGEVSGGVMYQQNPSTGEWADVYGSIYDSNTFQEGDNFRMNGAMLSAFLSAMQADCPYNNMEVQYKTYAWNTNKSVNAIHSGTSYPLAYNSDLTALAARVTALETALGNISSSLDTINGEVV